MKVLKKLILIISILLVGGYAILWIIYYSFIGPDPRLKDLQFRSQYKSIYIRSNIDSCCYIVCHVADLDTYNSFLSKIKEERAKAYFQQYSNDTIYLCGNNNTAEILLPILENDSSRLPNDFSIGIYGKDLKTLYKQVNLEEFAAYAKSNYKAGDNFFSAREWTLDIDSTLLGLKNQR